MTGILNINKPKGVSSSAVVSKVRKILGEKTIGHMGTLDPQAEGVLLLGVGKATKLFNHFLSKDKVYLAEFTFGYETDTLDCDGKIINETENLPSLEQIKSELKKQIGKINQIPPQYSAKNIAGRRAYDIARSGEVAELSASKVEIYNIEFISQVKVNVYTFNIHCSSGTYIRSICRDLAYNLNSLATMTALQRTRCGIYTIENSITLQQLEQNMELALEPIEKTLDNLQVYELDEKYYFEISNGIKIQLDNLPKNDFLLFCKSELFGISKSIEGNLKIITYLKDNK